MKTVAVTTTQFTILYIKKITSVSEYININVVNMGLVVSIF